MIDPTDLLLLKERVGETLLRVPVNNDTVYNLIVPKTVQNALFRGWEKRENVSFLLWQFAKDMDISTMTMSDNGTIYYIIKPPPPPLKGNEANGYLYFLVGKFLSLIIIFLYKALKF